MNIEIVMKNNNNNILYFNEFFRICLILFIQSCAYFFDIHGSHFNKNDVLKSS